MEKNQIKHVLEAALLASGRPLSVDQLQALFGLEHTPSRPEIRQALEALESDYAGRGITVKEVASGFRVQVRSTMAPWLASLWEERPPRYSRALMETLAIVAYRQPVTRGDVEQIRGVAVTTNIMRTLLERGWIKVVGYRDVPGKPAMYGTTREFLDYFSLKQLDDLPPLSEIRDLDRASAQLEFGGGDGSAGELAPGSPEQLVRALEGGLPEEPATVSSIDEARLATGLVAQVGMEEQGQDGDEDTPALAAGNVVPMKAR